MTWPRKQKRALWMQLRGGLKPNGSQSRRALGSSNFTSSKPMNRMRLRLPRMTVRMRLYGKRARLFLRRNTRCAVFPNLKATECHHVFGRRGRLLLWEPGWRAVSALGHAVIHRAPEAARRAGLLGPIGSWNDYEKAVASATRLRIIHE